jgi:hypothetical protein
MCPFDAILEVNEVIIIHWEYAGIYIDHETDCEDSILETRYSPRWLGSMHTRINKHTYTIDGVCFCWMNLTDPM